MAWIRLDDNFTDHPKVMASGALAGWLYVCGLTYCNRLMTDGFIPTSQVRRMADVEDPNGLAVRLVEVGLWERAPGGYRVRNYLEYQRSKAEIEAERAAAAARQARRRSRLSQAAVSHVSSNGVSHDGSHAVSHGGSHGVSSTDNSTEDINTLKRESVLKGTYNARARDGTASVSDAGETVAPAAPPPPRPIRAQKETPEEFTRFWAAYPKKEAKQDALAAWVKLRPSAEGAAAIMAGLERAKASPGWSEHRFIPHAATWLNGRRWEDEPEPAQPSRPAPGSGRSVVAVLREAFEDVWAQEDDHGDENSPNENSNGTGVIEVAGRVAASRPHDSGRSGTAHGLRPGPHRPPA